MTKRIAFLVGYLNKLTGTLESIGLYSEESPTMSFKFHPVTILAGYGDTYSMGVAFLSRALRSPEWAWTHRFMSAQVQQDLGVAS